MNTQTYTAVIAYFRYSSDAQSEGSSIERQRRDTETMANGHGWTIDRIVQDDGKSAFTGKHRAAGSAMHGFEVEVRNGEHNGAIVLLERLDRLSRQGHEEGMAMLRFFSANGVSVGTADDGRIYKAGEPQELEEGLVAMIRLSLANKESAVKSARLKSAYDIRHTRAREGKLAVTRLVAPWIVVRANRTMTLNPERVETLNMVFRWADELEMGADAIAKRLNREGVPVWVARKKKAALCWTRTRIGKMLCDRSAIGEFQPTRGGKPNGPAWLGHFPIAVDHDLFERVQRGAAGRKKGRISNRDVKINNLFATLISCECCGAKMAYQMGRRAGTTITTKNGSEYTYRRDNGSLVCPTATKYGKCTNRRYIAYLTFEETLLKACLHLAMDDTAFSRKDEVGRLNVTIAERERELTVALETANNLALAWAARPSDLRRKMADDAEDAAEALTSNVHALKRQREEARGRVTAQEHIARVEDIRVNLHHEDLETRIGLRRKVKHAMLSVIQKMTAHEDGSVTVVMDGGLVAFKIAGKTVSDIGDTNAALAAGVIALPRSGNRDIQGQIETRMKKASAN
ncbi:recombinase family protein [Sphingomonas sp. NFX23]|uniref:recombinase family protein n=1 Tax=Sphingomonas sp. NFX23 TaxID=2819532 RepID=UPI003CE8F0D2